MLKLKRVLEYVFSIQLEQVWFIKKILENPIKSGLVTTGYITEKNQLTIENYFLFE